MQGTVNQRLCTARAREKLRILQIGKFYPPHMGGIETHLQSLCGELRKSVNVKVVVANNTPTESEAVVDGVPVTRVGTWFTVASAPICPGMVRHIREANADIVHLHLQNPSAVLAYLASGREGPLVVTYHADTVRQRLLEKGFRPFLRRILDKSAAIIATSEAYIESSPVLPAYRDRCRAIPLGIPIEQFQRPNMAAVRKIREQHGPGIVLSVGRLVYYKGFEYLIEAMADVPGRLLIVGNGPLRSSLKQKSAALGLEDRVIFLGEVSDLVPYYHAADLFVLPSIARSEGFGIVQVEAMACARPVINTLIDSGVPFVSQDQRTGISVPPENAKALSRAISLLLDDPERREAYGRAAHVRAQREFTVEVMAQRTLQLYSEVLESVPIRRSNRSRGGDRAAFVSAGSPAG